MFKMRNYMRVIERTFATPPSANYRVKTQCGNYYGYFEKKPSIAKYSTKLPNKHIDHGFIRTGWSISDKYQLGSLIMPENHVELNEYGIVYMMIPEDTIDNMVWENSLVELLPHKLSEFTIEFNDDTSIRLDKLELEVDILTKALNSAEFALQYKEHVITYLECKNSELLGEINS